MSQFVVIEEPLDAGGCELFCIERGALEDYAFWATEPFEARLFGGKEECIAYIEAQRNKEGVIICENPWYDATTEEWI